MTTRFLTAVAAVVVLASSLAACGGDATEGPSTTLTVYAASSLKSVFEQLGTEFQADHRDVTVSFNFAGSSDLVAQIQQGAPADVFASADTANMGKLGDEALAPADFATNTLEIAVPADNPAHVATLADLARQGVQLVTCAPEVPCGAAAAAVEANARLDWKPVSEEQSVADVLGKVESGDADAGLVYVTDVRAAGDQVAGIAIPASVNAVNTYPIAALAGSEHADLAAAWVALVTGAEGQKALAAAGFGKA
ncbi:molybdate ABC transporter substrate-binding protein [Nocardioides jiangxiensis]|uniref:Molybdate ABC transporter substrate-binding protein n=1 Tax=Nocardioides jiangxiensis TaxID=3064524 RepID=A0ABT9B0X3_9ACTN|nr:molybdate ABC transporter substrate-binding protein [Nocardioides sp. WY-20]MDO7868511.1 molybdate ABC transporter substrate-binding protein [Nocardioides sp. WY-20]